METWNQSGDFSLDCIGIACTAHFSRYIAFDSKMEHLDKISKVSFTRSTGGDVLFISCVPEQLEKFKSFMEEKGFRGNLFAEKDIYFNTMDKEMFNCLLERMAEFDAHTAELQAPLQKAFSIDLINASMLNSSNKTICYTSRPSSSVPGESINTDPNVQEKAVKRKLVFTQ